MKMDIISSVGILGVWMEQTRPNWIKGDETRQKDRRQAKVKLNYTKPDNMTPN